MILFSFIHQRVRNHSLTSLCIISHHPFFSEFRECLFLLRRMIDACNENASPRRVGASRQNNRYRGYKVTSLSTAFFKMSWRVSYVNEIALQFKSSSFWWILIAFQKFLFLYFCRSIEEFRKTLDTTWNIYLFKFILGAYKFPQIMEVSLKQITRIFCHEMLVKKRSLKKSNQPIYFIHKENES